MLLLPSPGSVPVGNSFFLAKERRLFTMLCMTIASLKAAAALASTPFELVLLLRKVTLKTARNGLPFLSLECGDRTGSFTATLFSDHPAYELVKEMGEGRVVQVSGQTDFFQDRFSPRLDNLTQLPEEEIPKHLDKLIESSPEDPAQLWQELQEAISQLRHPELQQTVRLAIQECEDALRTMPAAIAMHHAYRHGLLEHTVHMVRAARALLPLYPEVHADLAMAGILLHDLGKTWEYSSELTTKRTQVGILQGHIVLGYRMVRRAGMLAKLAPAYLERLEHIILSHQGALEWGAAALAATPEAVFVSLVDNLDAKMGMVQRLLRNGVREGFSEHHPGLGGPLLLEPIDRS